VKKLFIKTFGCQMNVYDSARMSDALAGHGYTESGSAEDADVIILNTCHIREKAAEKVYSEIGRLRAIKERRARTGERIVIAVAGCVAQAEGAEIVRRAPAVDLVFGPQTYHRLPDLIEKIRQDRSAIVDTEFPPESKFDHLAPPGRAQTRDRGPSAFVTVQEGCDKFCTFCVVPYTRGVEASRPADAIRAEVERLAADGVREIMLLGQNVNAYHGTGDDGEWTLARLLRDLAGIEGIERLRYTTSHPRDMDDELIAVHGDLDQLMPYLHLPVQSGSDRILKKMNRGHHPGDYLEIIGRLRDARPDIALSGDFIVGFPGESDADFEATMALVRDVNYAQAYSFKYSPRPGTPAAGRDNQVPDEVKAARLAALQDLLNVQQLSFNDACIGRTLEVLLERPGRKPGQLLGRSPYLQAVHVDDCEHHLGEIVRVEIVAAHANSLSGRIAGTHHKSLFQHELGVRI